MSDEMTEEEKAKYISLMEKELKKQSEEGFKFYELVTAMLEKDLENSISLETRGFVISIAAHIDRMDTAIRTQNVELAFNESAQFTRVLIAFTGVAEDAIAYRLKHENQDKKYN